MTWNIAGYLLYLLLSTYTIVFIGKRLHGNGIHFIRKIFTNEETANSVNNLLLLGYYLVNIGYLFMTISYWEPITNFPALLLTLTERIGIIYLLLAVLHYNNILCLYLYAKWNHIDLFTLKNNYHG